jgi:cytidylate kinase
MIITIGRQLGSGGRETGQKLASALGIAYYDKELLEITAKKSGLNQRLFEQADEHTQRGLPAGMLGIRFPLFGDSSPHNCGLSHEMLFQIQSDVIRSLAERQSCVFIGRCADYILRDRTDCLNIFICANDDDRLRRIMSYQNITVEKARSMMESIDKKRAAYYNYYTNKTWGMAASYHFCLNSSILGIDEITEFVKRVSIGSSGKE